MKKKILTACVIALFMIVFMLTGCTEIQKNNNESIEDDAVYELQALSEESEIAENHSEDSEKIRYYACLDNHMQLLYDAFIACRWKEINDILEEFRIPDGEQVAVYTTPSEGLSLIIEYMPTVRSWQAYLGEVSEGKKEGSGVMVSKRGTGYISAGVYVGAWSNNMPNGLGILSNSVDNIEYILVGSFIDGRFDSTVQVYGLETSELNVDWDTINPRFYIDAAWNYADLTFDNGKPIPVEKDIVEQYISVSELTAHELNYLDLENDGQYYYRVYYERYNYIMSIGVKAPDDGYRGSVSFIYGTFFDLKSEEATYGVNCYTTNSFECY